MFQAEFSVEDMRRWLIARLGGGALSGAICETGGSDSAALTPAAVLVPLVLRCSGPTVLLTRRSQHLHDHPGQISFPGGRCEPTDAGPVQTALRETHEEIGLDPAAVDVVGRLPQYLTGTGFRVTPVVGLVRPPFELVVDEFEVAEVFEGPCGFLMSPGNRQKHRREVRGVVREYWVLPYGEYFIWGATAGMLVSLHRLLGGK